MVAQANRSKGANDQFLPLPAPVSGSRQIEGASAVRIHSSQEHTPVSRLSCAWGTPHAVPETTTAPRLVSSVFTRRCLLQKRSQPPTCAANNGPPCSPFDNTRHGLSSRSPVDKHASPDQARMGRIGCSQGSRKPPFLVSVRNLISHAAGTMYP
jgi:hypothetical protein